MYDNTNRNEALENFKAPKQPFGDGYPWDAWQSQLVWTRDKILKKKKETGGIC